MATYLTNTTDLKAVADKIRAKTGTATDLIFPDDFVDEIDDLLKPSGTKNITAAGTTDVSSYANASVAAGSATTPATSITANPTISASGGNISASVSASKSITPSVSAGYVASGTAGTASVSGSATVAATSLDANLVAGNIKDGVTIFGVTGNVKQKTNLAWHQDVEAVRNYIANVTYDPSDYSTSQIANYAPTPAVASNTKPIGETLDGVTYYNEIPNGNMPFSSTNYAGTVNPLDQVRWINSQTANFRDIGGWLCDGGKVKYGLIYRSGELAAADEDLVVNQLGIKCEVDLTADGTPAYGDKLRYVGHTSYAMYSLADTGAWRTNLRGIFDSVKYGDPVIFHCSMGADRTGTLACIIEAILGVSQSDVDKDYELTSFKWLRARNGNYQGGTADWAHLIGQIQALTGSTFRDKAIYFVASLGFTADEINAFRAAMIDGTPETITIPLSTFTVTKSGSNVTFDNSANTAAQFSTYETNITPASGFVIDSVSVTMGGVDITSQVFSGVFTPFGTKTITANGTHDVNDYQYAEVNVPGITPSGTVNITSTAVTDVTNYANAQVVDANLTAGNIKDGVDILGITGTYTGGSSVNCKIFSFTSAAAVANQYVTVVSGDADVAAHYTDPNAMVTIRKMSNNSSNGLALVVSGNHAFPNGYGAYMNFNGSANNVGTLATPISEATTPSAINIRCNSSGDITIRCSSLQNNFGGADYIITFSW